MSFDALRQVFDFVIESYSRQIPIMVGLALLFTVIAVFESQTSSPGKVWWRNPGLATDISYGLIHGLIAPYFRLPVLIVVAVLLSRTMPVDEVAVFLNEGRGPLGGLPFWWQAVIYVVGSDFLLYWIHRTFHNAMLWRFHAIHHSATEVDWTTTYRFHPINLMLQPSLVGVIMVTLGISPAVMLFFVPFDIISAAWVHANLNWTLGPFKYIISGPVFHRWHHGPVDDGGSSNFAPTFAIWDWLFGTFHMPEGRLPEHFGIDDHEFPEGYFAQLIYPFKKPLDGVADHTADVQKPV
jgi:sterol desaturase/sphingolipid hydroxylase (fatty acid hydroxylase superfamily)